MLIRPATEMDLPSLLAIHNYAVRELDAIWVEQEETLEERRDWFNGRLGAGYPILVAVDDDDAVIGYGTFGSYRPKEGYRLTVEHSLYILPQGQGKGTGNQLMKALIDIARTQGRHVMVAVIDDQNTTSVKMHGKFGFTLVGHMPQTGIKNGRWLGQVSMILQLDDRETPKGA